MLRSRERLSGLAVALVVAAACYTAALCLYNTRFGSITNTLVAVCDGAIIVTAVILSLRGASRWLWIVLSALAVNFLLITLFSERFELKSVRDPLVLIAFAALGLRYGTFERARAAFLIVSAIVMGFALFEFLAPGAYTQFFNVIRFYDARGMVDATAVQRLDSAFFVSGLRDGDRMLLPFLGGHRVSSIFLEPVSMGNFGALALVFALSLGRAHWRTALVAAAVGFAAIVLADARFATMVAPFFLIARLLPATWTRIGIATLPLLSIGLLFLFAVSDVGRGDDLPTRLAGSGRLLLELSPQTLFGFAPYEITTYDSGYAYAFSAFGLPACIMLWAAFVLFPAPTREAQRYKLLLGVYLCALLCISGTSAFALKTAALAFYTLGAFAALRAPRPAPSTARRAGPALQTAPA